MKKLLFTFMLMIVFSTSFATQIKPVNLPTYEISMSQPAEGIGLDKVTAVNSATIAIGFQSITQFNSNDATIKTVAKYNVFVLSGVRASYHSDAIGVSGGDSIGIRQLS